LLKNLAFLLCAVSDTEQLEIRTHSLAISHDFVENIFLKALFITNCSDLSTDLLTGHASDKRQEHSTPIRKIRVKVKVSLAAGCSGQRRWSD